MYGLDDECGIGAAYELEGRPSTEVDLTVFLGMLRGIQGRGQDAAGAFSAFWEGFHHERVVGRVSELRNPSELRRFLVQTRYRTSGPEADDLNSAQPCVLERGDGSWFAFVFNGNVPGEGLDTHRIRDLMEEVLTNGGAFRNIPTVLNGLSGSYSLVYLDSENNFLACQDRHQVRPLVYARYKGRLLVASESAALPEDLESEALSTLEPGEFLMVDGQSRHLEKGHLAFEVTPKQQSCMLELFYFLRRNSVVGARSVESWREALGAALAKVDDYVYEDPTNVLVVPVPNTAIPSAQAYAKAKSYAFSLEALRKNPGAQRTFISPDLERKRLLREKYAYRADLMVGRDLLVVDDSIVRGSTLKHLLGKLRSFGPQSLRVVIPAPPLYRACHLGVNLATDDELLAHRVQSEMRSGVSQRELEQEMAKQLGVDGLRYLTLEQVKAVLGPNLCTGCVDGNYPYPRPEQQVGLSVA